MSLKYVETKDRTYIATNVIESVYGIHLKEAFMPNLENIGRPDHIARDYLRKKANGSLFSFHIPSSELESICDATQESDAISVLCSKQDH